jgi:hypothetical protein
VALTHPGSDHVLASADRALAPLQVMLPRFWVASTKPEAALGRSQGWFSLGKGEGGLWRRVIAGQKRWPYCLEGR